MHYNIYLLERVFQVCVNIPKLQSVNRVLVQTTKYIYTNKHVQANAREMGGVEPVIQHNLWMSLISGNILIEVLNYVKFGKVGKVGKLRYVFVLQDELKVVLGIVQLEEGGLI